MSFKHAFIVPLIGGQLLGQVNAFESKPDYILSYTPFSNNDSHIVNHYKDVPYILLDQGGKHPHQVDIVGTTCPCAGLSSLSGYASSDAAANDWMYTTTTYVLEQIKPLVMWGENAPGFAGKLGKPIVDKLQVIAKRNGYTMSIYRTKSLLHGVPQIRERSFYFFWKGTTVPIFNYFDKPLNTIESVFASVKPDALQQEVTNKHIPSQHDPMYRYVLEELEGGITHKEFYERIAKTDNAMDWLERKGKKYDEVGAWMRKQGLDRAADRCDRIFAKLQGPGNIMRRLTTVPKGHIGAFVGHYPNLLTHPTEDRYLTYREAMTIMGLPQDFELLQPAKFLNHVCQNVPVGTATDIANEVRASLEGKRDRVKADLLYQFNGQQTYEVRDSEPIQSLESFF
jgi:site-specific DNA-cytosine methylase